MSVSAVFTTPSSQGEQGRIPLRQAAERRRVIEEGGKGAGIHASKASRDIAEVKLQEANSNMLASTLISEGRATRRSLKRQESAARRYRRRRRAYRELRAIVIGRWEALLGRGSQPRTARQKDATSRDGGPRADLHATSGMAAGRERLDALPAA